MKPLNKVAAATGQDMGFLMDSLVRGVGRLSPMILDNLGIQVDLTQSYEDWADANGKAVKDMTKSEQQMAVMDQVMTMLAKNTENLPEMSDPFQQLAVTMTNLKDEVAMTLGPVVLPLIQDLADSVSAFVQSDEFQQWIQEAAAWLKNSLIPALREIFKWIGQNLPPVIAFLSNVWMNVLQPALQWIYDFIVTYTIPAWQAVFAWLGEKLPPVIAFLAEVWSTILKPALEAIWAFIQDYYIPAWQAIFEWIGEKLPPIIQFFTDLWNDVLAPALMRVRDVIINYMVPGFKIWIIWIKKVIGWVKKIWGWVKKLIDRVKGFKLPSWMIGNSPSPLENSLRGIADAMGDVAKASGFMGNSASFSGAGANKVAGQSFVYVNYSPAVSLASREEVETVLVPFIENAQRRARG